MNLKQPLISIIIPVYNREKIISETLDSIITQEYINWECLLIDDGSSDNTKKVIEKYLKIDNRFKLYDRPEEHKPGSNGARIYGFKLSKGDFIQWFDSDDLMHEKLLSKKLDIFQANKKIQTVLSPLSFFEQDKIIGQNEFHPRSGLLYENIITWSIPAWTQSIMFRKEFLLKCGEHFDESLKRLTDYDFYCRIFIKCQPKTFLLDEHLILVRRNNPNSITTVYFDENNIANKELSEYVVSRKIIKLLINENKFSDHLEQYFLNDHKRRITILLKQNENEISNLFKSSIEQFLTYKKRNFLLFKFRLGYALAKEFPIDNYFLIYKTPRFINIIKKAIFKKGYLKEKISKRIQAINI